MLTEFLPLVHRSLEQLPVGELRASNVYLDNQIHQAGMPLAVGGQTITPPKTSLLVFIDSKPVGNWGHPCKYLLIGTEDGATQEFDSQFPPPRQDLRLVQRGENVEDWTLLTKLRIDDESHA